MNFCRKNTMAKEDFSSWNMLESLALFQDCESALHISCIFLGPLHWLFDGLDNVSFWCCIHVYYISHHYNSTDATHLFFWCFWCLLIPFDVWKELTITLRWWNMCGTAPTNGFSWMKLVISTCRSTMLVIQIQTHRHISSTPGWVVSPLKKSL